MGKYLVKPHNEMTLREWMMFNLYKLPFNVVKSELSFPDCVIELEGKEFRTEIEYKSSNFISHGHDVNGCDVVICWIHNCRIPLFVFELSTGSKYLENETSKIIEKDYDEVKDKWLKLKAKAKAKVKAQYKKQLNEILAKNENLRERYLDSFFDDLMAEHKFMKGISKPRMKLLSVQREIVRCARESRCEKLAVDIKELHPREFYKVYRSALFGETC